MLLGLVKTMLSSPKHVLFAVVIMRELWALATSWWDSSVGRWSRFKYLAAIKQYISMALFSEVKQYLNCLENSS